MKSKNIKIHLSISDDFPWAIAFVIISGKYEKKNNRKF